MRRTVCVDAKRAVIVLIAKSLQQQQQVQEAVPRLEGEREDIDRELPSDRGAAVNCARDGPTQELQRIDEGGEL